MTIKHTIAATSAAANATGLATAQTGSVWTLAATSAGDSLAHLITITNNSITDHSGKTALITGTAADGSAQTETHALPASSVAITTLKRFKTVTSVVPSATIGIDTMGIGWSADSVSAPVSMFLHKCDFVMGFGCVVDTGAPTYSVQHSFDGANWFNHAVVTAKTVNADGSYLFPVLQLRLNFTAAGGVTFTGLQVDQR